MPDWHNHCQVGCLAWSGGGQGCNWGRLWGGCQPCPCEGQSGAGTDQRASRPQGSDLSITCWPPSVCLHPQDRATARGSFTAGTAHSQQMLAQWLTSCSSLAQVIMRSCSGINFEEFYHFLKVIAKRRLLVLAKEAGPDEAEGGEGTGLGPQQAVFDVGRIAEVLASVVVHPDFQRLDTSVFSPQPEDLLQQLEEVVATTTSL